MKRKLTFCFDTHPKRIWYEHLLKGFNHCFLVEQIGKSTFYIDPLYTHAHVRLLNATDKRDLTKFTCVHVESYATPRSTYIPRYGLQTCATLIQYISGIHVGAVTAQGLHDKLVSLSEDQQAIRRMKILF